MLGNSMYPFTFGGVTDVGKIGDWLYPATGKVTSTQDGSTGAYEHVFELINNVVLPPFTLFYAVDGEHDGDEVGYKRMKGCFINTLKIAVTQTSARFEGTGMGTEEDDELNSSSSVSGFQITDIQYQSSGLIRVQLNTTDLSSVENGDVLDTTGATGISNASNIGQHIVVNVDDAADYIEIINPNRLDATDDETGLTATGSTIEIIQNPVYPDPVGVLLHRHSCVADDVVGGDFSTVTEYGLGEFEIEIQNNGDPLFEECRSRDALVVLAGEITTAISWDQIISTNSGQKAKTFKEGDGVKRAWRFLLEDTSINLGTSTTYHPLLQTIIPEGLGIAAREGMQSGDKMRYGWAMNTSNEQGIQITLRNETAAYPA
ncbi:MAG: hypothetical protein ACFFDH_00085 [Promethearchaeota archaeon]